MNTKRICSTFAAVIGYLPWLLAVAQGQDAEADEAPAIEVRSRGWKVIANGEETPSTAAGTDFGERNTLDGYRQRVYYILNRGNAPLLLGDPETPDAPAVTLSGDGAAQFEITDQPRSSLDTPSRRRYSRYTSFAILFNPDAVGVHSATVSIVNNAPDSSPYTFTIQGEGLPSDDDHSDRYQFATPIETDAAVAGTLEKERDEDWFTFTLAEPMEISAQSVSAVNVKAGLYTSRGRFIVSNDDDGGEGNFLITRILEAGQYFLKVRASNRRDTGTYEFTVAAEPADIAPEIIVSGNNMEIASGATETSADDGTNFGDVLTGERLRRSFLITNDGSATLNLSDVAIAAEAGFTLSRRPASALRPGKSTSLRVTFAPTAEGPANAIVSIGNNDTDENPFTFTVSGNGTVPPPDDHGNSAEDATVLAENTATGVIGDRKDEDFFSFATEGEVQIVLETTGDLDTIGRLYDAEGKRLASDDNDGEGRNFRIVEAVSAGTYFIRVGARGSGTGDYTLAVTTSEPAPEMSVLGYVLVDSNHWWPHYASVEIASGSTEASAATGTDFGAVNVDDKLKRRIYKVRNGGSTALELNGDPVVSISGDGAAAYSVSRLPSASIRAGRYTYFRIVFDPVKAGTASAVISIANNDADENPYSFAITGEGTVPVEPEPEPEGEGEGDAPAE